MAYDFTHHVHKLDAPSGTAITLAEEIIDNIDRKKDWKRGVTYWTEETHHVHKLDAPSGTAITLAEEIIDNIDLSGAKVVAYEDSRADMVPKYAFEGNAYLEASYLLNGTLDATAREYWTVLRQRAGISTDFDKTIAATDMSKEAENDWGAYTGGSVISDKTLYNIRRERRCEFLAEGLRYMDLCRWRSMDQLMTAPSHLEGMHLWNTPMEDWYLDDNGNRTRCWYRR